MEKKRGNTTAIIVILVVLLLAAIGTAVYFYLQLNTKSDEISDLKNDVETLKSEMISVENQNAINEEKEVVVEKMTMPVFNVDRIKNKAENVTYFNSISYFPCDFTITVEDGALQVKTKDGSSLNVSGITGKVRKAVYGILGDGYATCLIVINDSGDVYYVKEPGISVADAQDSSNNKLADDLPFKKVDGVSDICDVITTISKGNGGTSTRVTFVAIDTNGDCYDLYDMIK